MYVLILTYCMGNTYTVWYRQLTPWPCQGACRTKVFGHMFACPTAFSVYTTSGSSKITVCTYCMHA